MDLAEIRKKARLKYAPVERLGQDVVLSPPAAERARSNELEIPVERFWDAESNLPLVTEEEYALALQNHSAESEATSQWLTFVCGSEEYSLELATVLELIRPRRLTELPRSPDFLLGIVSLRGQIVPVVDLARRLNLKPSDDTSQQRVIVCSAADERIGLLVDRVVQVVRVKPEQVESAPLLADSPSKDFISGIGRVQGKMLVLLNPERILDVEPQAVLKD
jgi:purine-binding chemotaxis protein CheW